MLHNFRAQDGPGHRQTLAAVALDFLKMRSWPGTVALSHDSRPGSVEFARDLVEVLPAKTIYWLSQTTTPVASCFGQSADVVGVHITASHSEIGMLGLKLLDSGTPISLGEEATLRANVWRKSEFAFEGASSSTVVDCEDVAWTTYADHIQHLIGDERPIVEVRFPWLSRFQRYLPKLRYIGRASVDAAREAQAPPVPDGAPVARLDEDGDQLVFWRDNRRMSGAEVMLRWFLNQEGTRIAVLSYDTPRSVVQHLTSLGLKIFPTPVGDQVVVSQMLSVGASVGGEPNGHLINLSLNKVPDALAAGLIVARSPHAVPPTEPYVRYAARGVAPHDLAAQLRVGGYLERFGMWERFDDHCRHLFRISAYEDSVVVQCEGSSRVGSGWPEQIAHVRLEVLDLQE